MLLGRRRLVLLYLTVGLLALLSWRVGRESGRLFGQYFVGLDYGAELGNRTVVLMWTKYYAVSDELLMDAILSGRKWDQDCCSGNDLVVTLDRNHYEYATVVVFFNYPDNLRKKDLPSYRPPGQLWVLFCKESPIYSQILNGFANIFNWTMSYRRDSDIYSPYGLTFPVTNPSEPKSQIMMPGNVTFFDWVARKTDTIVGVISNCPSPSRRERLLHGLRNAGLPFALFGQCGNLTICSRKDHSCDHEKWWYELASKYKFFYAAENSLCVDYITEKFWRTLELGMMPVVYGGANYTAVAPPHSFIDVRDFSSPQKIADYLNKVANDPIEYAKYFEWRREYAVRITDGWGGWCTLCKLARQYKNNPEKVDISPYKSYKYLAGWWTTEKRRPNKRACSRPLSQFVSR